MSSGSTYWSIVVRDALKTRDLPDRANGCPAYLPRALGNGIRHRENLLTLVIEHQVIIAEMRPGHVPMKVFRFEV